jgi:hypothetical protein
MFKLFRSLGVATSMHIYQDIEQTVFSDVQKNFNLSPQNLVLLNLTSKHVSMFLSPLIPMQQGKGHTG